MTYVSTVCIYLDFPNVCVTACFIFMNKNKNHIELMQNRHLLSITSKSVLFCVKHNCLSYATFKLTK